MTEIKAEAMYKFLDVIDKLDICRIAASMIRNNHRLFVMTGAQLYTIDYEERNGRN